MMVTLQCVNCGEQDTKPAGVVARVSLFQCAKLGCEGRNAVVPVISQSVVGRGSSEACSRECAPSVSPDELPGEGR